MQNQTSSHKVISYNVIARKYRPQTFADVVGQQHVVHTLKNAIAINRVAHAYLFSGPRGVGKTTLARILAKALNCLSENVSPANRPCGDCESCKAVVTGSSYLYQEIDGASHRGIDGMREIKDELSYSATKDRWRIFVIDEVHMLTTEAFNAMLKALEEPPERVVFIFCTTESHRIPATVRSRTQHFQFRLLSIEAIHNVLKAIAEKEKLPCTSQALFLLAKKAAGSIRDAENLLEQVAAFTRPKMEKGGEITHEDVLSSLSLSPMEEIHRFVKNLYEGKLALNFELLKKLLHDGFRLEDFFYQLAEFLTEVLSFKLGVRDASVLEVFEEEMQTLSGYEEMFSEEDLHLLTDIVFEYILELRASANEALVKNFFLHKIHRYQKMITTENLREELLFFSRGIEKPPIHTELPPEKQTNNAEKTKSSEARLQIKKTKEAEGNDFIAKDEQRKTETIVKNNTVENNSFQGVPPKENASHKEEVDEETTNENNADKLWQMKKDVFGEGLR